VSCAPRRVCRATAAFLEISFNLNRNRKTVSKTLSLRPPLLPDCYRIAQDKFRRSEGLRGSMVDCVARPPQNLRRWVLLSLFCCRAHDNSSLYCCMRCSPIEIGKALPVLAPRMLWPMS
jgi:hypothetical protein